MKPLNVFTQHLIVVTKKKTLTSEKTNIIFSMSDDHAYQAISTHSGIMAELAPTSIDRIAEAGIL
ncbi:hypothetical protein [Algoriphagus sp. Y33]|uniref:hypothetical protein n=1 Tax=Algoriphagus sp. Y33 TaxID=2772483 RepID=UPI00177A9073|nr:hypothetical protein [Algoriphagus sp. Y33]